jgi:hypothetical protein
VEEKEENIVGKPTTPPTTPRDADSEEELFEEASSADTQTEPPSTNNQTGPLFTGPNNQSEPPASGINKPSTSTNKPVRTKTFFFINCALIHTHLQCLVLFA